MSILGDRARRSLEEARSGVLATIAPGGRLQQAAVHLLDGDGIADCETQDRVTIRIPIAHLVSGGL